MTPSASSFLSWLATWNLILALWYKWNIGCYDGNFIANYKSWERGCCDFPRYVTPTHKKFSLLLYFFN